MNEVNAMISSHDLCRLCSYNSTDVINIYSDSGISLEYEKKINKYLYLLVHPEDELPKIICWMCSQQLDSFHKFHEKINEIQQKLLKERYDFFVIKNYVESNLETSGCPEGHIEELEEDHIDDMDRDDSNMEIVPVSNEENSFILVKSDKPLDKNIAEQSDESENKEENLLHEDIEVQVKEESDESVQVFEIRRSNRQTRAKLNIKTLVKDTEDEDFQASNDDEEFVMPEKVSKRKRGRPQKEKSTDAGKKSEKRKFGDIPFHYFDDNEGVSDNEFPARDSDNEEWPAQQTLNKFPDRIIENGLLLVKGKKLMGMICKFYNLECDLCEKEKPRFKQLKELFQHYSNEHKEEGYVMCCQTKLNRYPAIIMHMARHLQPDAFKCNICSYIVTRPRFLESHKLTHLPEDEKPFACDQCPRRFCWKGALQIHMISHQPAGERKLYVCHVCGKVYDTPGGLSTHKKLIHTDRIKESHVCDVCAKTFATRTGLKEHMSTIHQPREKDQVQCTTCDKWLMNNRCLKSHMLLHSDVDYNCSKCDYVTKKRVLLKRHELTQHSDEKPFSCELCGKSFKLKRALTVHVAQHNTTKTYKCTFCIREFASSTNFYTHRKNMHPAELSALKEEQEAVQRLKRIQAGIEEEVSIKDEYGNQMLDQILPGTKFITINNRKYEIAANEVDTMIVLDCSPVDSTFTFELPTSSTM